ncbi:sugar kinase [Enterococcus faecalis]|nr:sugar kinase [Enterococcus faecalis]NST48834.1 sugar kinase [Enterococcus faecalis]
MGKVVTLGEIMLRLSTPVGIRVAQTENFAVHYGGGEANVAISLANYGHQVTFASKVPDNSLGEAAKKHLSRYGVSTEFVRTGGTRLGTYYLETGTGERAASVVYDRAYSSFAQIEEMEWDLHELFSGVEIFHISGITAALSKTWQSITVALVKAAKQAGCQVSFDINYRGKLWSQKEASVALKAILPFADICSAGVLDARYLLEIPEPEEELEDALTWYYRKMQERYPNIQVFYSTKRQVHSATDNELIGTLWYKGAYYTSKCHRLQPIVDRVGAGDAFAGGVLHGILATYDPQTCIDFATAASALKHTVHGDCNQFSQKEVLAFLATGSGKINR